MLKLKLYWVQPEFPDSRWSIEASPDSESPSVLAVFIARREQGVIRDELCLAKGDVGSVGCRAARYRYGPHGRGDVAPRRVVDAGVAVRHPLGDKDGRSLSASVALAIVGQKTKFCKGIIGLVLWRVRLGDVYQGGL